MVRSQQADIFFKAAWKLRELSHFFWALFIAKNTSCFWRPSNKNLAASNCPLLATQPRHEVLAHVVVDSLLLPIDFTRFRGPQGHDGWVVSHIPGTWDIDQAMERQR